MKKTTLVRRTSRDPVTSYARSVVNGRIVAGRLVRLACARHLHDLDRQRTDPTFPFLFDTHRSCRVRAFFREFLTLDDGCPFELMPWQLFHLGSLEGWIDSDGHQRFQTSFLETSKGSGKTPCASGYGLYYLAGKNERGCQIYSLGVDAAQASYLYKFAQRMATRSDELQSVLDIGEHNIAWIEHGSFFRPLSAEGRSLDNKLVGCALVDELQEHPSSVIPEKMRLGFKGRHNAILYEMANAGYDKTSVCWEHHAYSVKVLEGVVTGAAAERWFAYICQLDPCETHRVNGLTQPDDGCPDCDDWTDPSCWLKVQPSLGVTMSTAQLQAVVDEARDRPAAQARTKRLSFCMWTQSHTIWIPSDQWDACRSETVRPTSGVPCAAAFDMSMKLDLTGCAIAQRFDDPPAAKEETVEIDENENGQKVKRIWKIKYRIRLKTFAWLPEDTLVERVKNEQIPYDVWRRAGHLRVTPGPVIDENEIYDQFVGEIGPTYRPQRVGYDPYNATGFAVDLRDRAKYTVVEIGQGRKLSEYIKLFYALVRLRRIEHDGDPVFAWCVANAEPKYDRYENIWLEKPSGGKRIDLAIAAVMAVSQVILLPTPSRRKRVAAKAWTPEGWNELGRTAPIEA